MTKYCAISCCLPTNNTTNTKLSLDLVDSEHQRLMLAIYSPLHVQLATKSHEITVFLLVFLRSCAAHLK